MVFLFLISSHFLPCLVLMYLGPSSPLSHSALSSPPLRHRILSSPTLLIHMKDAPPLVPCCHHIIFYDQYYLFFFLFSSHSQQFHPGFCDVRGAPEVVYIYIIMRAASFTTDTQLLSLPHNINLKIPLCVLPFAFPASRSFLFPSVIWWPGREDDSFLLFRSHRERHAFSPA